MRTLIGATIGSLALGVLLLASGVFGVFEGGPAGAKDANFSALGALSGENETVVACDVGQRAVIRHVRLGEREVNQVECVSWASTPAVDTLRGVGSSGDVRIVRAAYPSVDRRIEPDNRVVYREAPARTVARSRSWQKSALIIGGTAGAGAGVGAIVGGKKGALLGAAIGAGAATVYDQITRRHSNR